MENNENKPVQQNDQNAGAGQGVEKKDVDPNAPKDQGTDYAKLLAEKDNEIKQLAVERDNYKRGLLNAKDKKDGQANGGVGDDQPEDVDSKIQKAVQDALYSEKQKKLMAEKEALFEQALKENKELKIAIANKQGMSGAPDGGSSDTQVTTPQFLSGDQIKDLKARGWDDAKIKLFVENYKNQRGR